MFFDGVGKNDRRIELLQFSRPEILYTTYLSPKYELHACPPVTFFMEIVKLRLFSFRRVPVTSKLAPVCRPTLFWNTLNQCSSVGDRECFAPKQRVGNSY